MRASLRHATKEEGRLAANTGTDQGGDLFTEDNISGDQVSEGDPQKKKTV